MEVWTTRVRVLAAIGAMGLAPAWSGAQSTTAAVRPDRGSTLESEPLRDLPAGGSVFSVLDTTQPEIVSDRFFSGGLNAGVPARLGAFLGSWTQTQFRIGDANVTDPAGSGSPLLWPELLFWQRVGTTTGLMPVDVSASALVVTLNPRRPGPYWTHVVDGMVTLPSDSPSGEPPAIQRLTNARVASALVSGPLVSGRLGLVAAGSWIGTSQTNRAGPASIGHHVASVFAHLVFTATPRDEVRTLGWMQRASTGEFQDTSFHLQSAWERRGPPERPAWRIVGSYTQRERTPQAAAAALTVDSITSGPVSDLIGSGGGTTRRWMLGARFEARAPRQTLTAGVDLDGAALRVPPAGIGQVTELVGGMPARIWEFTGAGIDARRHGMTIAAYGNDRIEMTPRLALNAGLRFDTVSAAADGSARGVRWFTWQPRVNLRWHITRAGSIAFIAGYGRSAYQLPLDFLAIGDPAAPVADVYRWDGHAIGPLIARVGPGTGGDAAFCQIDPHLIRPQTDEVVLAIESRPTKTARLRLEGVVRREQSLIGLTDTGAPLSVYTVFGVADPGLNLADPADRQILPVYNRVTSSFGEDRYVLTNRPGTASFAGLEAIAEVTAGRWHLLAGATASHAVGPAAGVGFLPTENDQDTLGDLFIDPNAGTHVQGRLFSDRAYTVKLGAAWQLPWALRLGIIARYQDGQPFARLVIVPGLNQGPGAVRAFANGGSRFTYTGTLDVRLQKRVRFGGSDLTAIVDAYNLLDLANEVEELVVTGPAFRTPSAVQPPRAVLVGIRVAR